MEDDDDFLNAWLPRGITVRHINVRSEKSLLYLSTDDLIFI